MRSIVIIVSFLIPWGRQDHYNWAADQRLSGEQKRAVGPGSAPAFCCESLGNGVSLSLVCLLEEKVNKCICKAVNPSLMLSRIIVMHISHNKSGYVKKMATSKYCVFRLFEMGNSSAEG